MQQAGLYMSICPCKGKYEMNFYTIHKTFARCDQISYKQEWVFLETKYYASNVNYWTHDTTRPSSRSDFPEDAG